MLMMERMGYEKPKHLGQTGSRVRGDAGVDHCAGSGVLAEYGRGGRSDHAGGNRIHAYNRGICGHRGERVHSGGQFEGLFFEDANKEITKWLDDNG